MRYLLLSDIHANHAALEAVLETVGTDYDRVICLGDVVGYGPDPNEAVDRVRALDPVAVVRGNHDKACAGITNAEDFNAIARFAAAWTQQTLTEDNLTWLREMPEGPATVDDIQLVHGSPLDEDDYLFTWREAAEVFSQPQPPLTFFGHTHLQGGFALRPVGEVGTLELGLPPEGVVRTEFTLKPDVKYLINPGSIGQPRDADPRAGLASYDSERGVVEYWRIPYSIETTQEKMREAALPQPLVLRLSLGR